MTKKALKAKAKAKTKKFDGEYSKNMYRHIFGDRVPVDAKNDMQVHVKPTDIKHAIRGDVCECVFARAIKRQFGAKLVIMMRSVAYVLIHREGKVVQVERYVIKRAAQRFIIDFDWDKPVPANTTFILHAPAKSACLKYVRERLNPVKQKNWKNNGSKATNPARIAIAQRRRMESPDGFLVRNCSGLCGPTEKRQSV